MICQKWSLGLNVEQAKATGSLEVQALSEVDACHAYWDEDRRDTCCDANDYHLHQEGGERCRNVSIARKSYAASYLPSKVLSDAKGSWVSMIWMSWLNLHRYQS